MPEVSLAELMSREDSSTSTRCWQGTEVETEDWWALETPTRSPERCSPFDGFEILKKSSSSKPLYHAGHRTLFSCFRQSSLNLTEPDLEPRTPPSTSSTARRGANASTFTFMAEAMEHHHQTDYDEDLHPDAEPTSPVVNCIGQVRPKKKQKQRKKMEPAPKDSEKLRRTKSQAPVRSAGVPRVAKSKSGKWKQLLQRSGSSSSSISPSNHSQSDIADSVVVGAAIDLRRFDSSAR